MDFVVTEKKLPADLIRIRFTPDVIDTTENKIAMHLIQSAHLPL